MTAWRNLMKGIRTHDVTSKAGFGASREADLLPCEAGLPVHGQRHDVIGVAVGIVPASRHQRRRFDGRHRHVVLRDVVRRRDAALRRRLRRRVSERRLAKSGVANLGGQGFGSRARPVRQCRHSFGKLEKDFAFHLSSSDSFTARYAARFPIFNDEAMKKEKISIITFEGP